VGQDILLARRGPNSFTCQLLLATDRRRQAAAAGWRRKGNDALGWIQLSSHPPPCCESRLCIRAGGSTIISAAWNPLVNMAACKAQDALKPLLVGLICCGSLQRYNVHCRVDKSFLRRVKRQPSCKSEKSDKQRLAQWRVTAKHLKNDPARAFLHVPPVKNYTVRA
jgi:hypothetical protein